MPAGGAAAKAGIKAGDIIIEYNGRPVANSDALVKMVVSTKPGSTVPIKVLREKQEKTLNVTVDELDLEAEQNTTRRTPQQDQPPAETQGASGFGLTLENVTPQIARRLRLPSGQTGAVITDVDQDGALAGFLRAGDVILSVNGKTVSNNADVARELGKVASGRIARILVWRDGGETFVPVKKD